jgi:hypothetical protein
MVGYNNNYLAMAGDTRLYSAAIGVIGTIRNDWLQYAKTSNDPL